MKIDWSKQNCGVMLCTFDKTVEYMPDVEGLLNELKPTLDLPEDEYLVDVKVHMLMPKQFPCIPNWHRDFLPRDENLKRNPRGVTGEKMYMWISGEPLTLYRDSSGKEYEKPANKWSSFTQNDLHRGQECAIHTWRGFIRVIPKKFVHGHTTNIGERRIHTQVYLNSNKFSW